MELSLKEQSSKSVKSKNESLKENDTGIDSDNQKNHDLIDFGQNNFNSNPHPTVNQLDSDSKQNRAQSSNIQPSSHQNAVLANKKQYIEAIRQSYLVLSIPEQISPSKLNKKPTKKSFVAISEEDYNDQKIIESLKTPLKINLTKINQNHKFIELSEGLEIFNGKSWNQCNFDIDTKSQELIISNLHIPFSTITKIKIYKPNLSSKLREVKVTYEKGKEEGVLNLNMNGERQGNRVPGEYQVFQKILVQKLTFQNRFKQTKWEKKAHVVEQIMLESFIFGQIYKKSQFLGRWQKRYVVLNEQGIFSYKSLLKKEEHSFCIERDSIEYMWSRFDMVENHLIIKIKHGLTQTEFAIPIAAYAYPHYKNWLYYFYKLMNHN